MVDLTLEDHQAHLIGQQHGDHDGHSSNQSPRTQINNIHAMHSQARLSSTQQMEYAAAAHGQLFDTVSSMVHLCKQQYDKISILEGVVTNQRELLTQQGEQFAETVKAMNHKIRMLEYNVAGHDFDPVDDKSDEELDEIFKVWLERKNSGVFEKEAEEAEAAHAAEVVRIAAENEERLRLELQKAEMDRKAAMLEEEAKRRSEAEAKAKALLEDMEKKMHEEHESAEAAAIRAKEAQVKAEAAAAADRGVKITHPVIASISDAITAELQDKAEQGVGTGIGQLQETIRVIISDEVGAEHMTDKVNASIDTLTEMVNKVEIMGDNLQIEVEKLLCETWDLPYRKHAKHKTVELAVTSSSVDPSILDAMKTQLDALQRQFTTRLDDIEGKVNDAHDKIVEQGRYIEETNAALKAKPLVPENLEMQLDAMAKVVERAERGDFDPSPHDTAPPAEYFAPPSQQVVSGSSSGSDLPFPHETIVRYIDGELPEAFINTVKDSLRLSDIVTDLNIRKAESDDLASLKKAVAEISDSMVTHELLGYFADLGSNPKAGPLLGASMKMKEALSKETKTNVDMNLAQLSKEIDDKFSGARAFTKLESQRAEDRAVEKIQQEEQRALASEGELKTRLGTAETLVSTMDQRITALMWTEGAKTAEGEIVKRDPVEEERARDELRAEMNIVKQNIQKLLESQQGMIDNAIQRCQITERSVSSKATQSHVDEVVDEAVQLFTKSINDNMSHIRETMSNLTQALENKAGKDEVLGLFRTQAPVKGGASVTEADLMAAISTHCISCGGPRGPSPPRQRPMSTPSSIAKEGSLLSQTLMVAPGEKGFIDDIDDEIRDDNETHIVGSNQSQSNSHELTDKHSFISAGSGRNIPPVMFDKTLAEKYAQVAGIIQGQAGLQSLQRQYQPMAVKPHPFLRKQNQPPEPLYRRARMAASMRESNKRDPPRSAPAGMRNMIRYDASDNSNNSNGQILPQLRSPSSQQGRRQPYQTMTNSNSVPGLDEISLGSKIE